MRIHTVVGEWAACWLALLLVRCSDAPPGTPAGLAEDSADTAGAEPAETPADNAEPENTPGTAAPLPSAAPEGSNAVPSGAPSGVPAPSSSVADPQPTVPGELRVINILNQPNKVLSRLTHAQFLNSVSLLLGEAAVGGLAELLPEQVPNGGFGNSGYAQSQPYDVILAYDTAALQAVSNVGDWAVVHARFGACAELACLDVFVRAFGERAFRRPLNDEEVTALMPIRDAALANALDLAAATRLLVRAILQAPAFLYHFEDEVLTDYQLASRLSFFIADAPPDDALYADAAAGQLRTPGVLLAHADRLLDAYGDRLGRAFAYDFLALRRARQRVVDIEDAVLAGLIASAEDSFAELLRTDAPVESLFTTESFVANDTTAAFIGAATGSATLQPSASYPFMGLLTHPATLIAMSNAVEGSTVSRGQFVAHQLLCIPPTPPPAMAFNPEDAGELPPNATQRDEGEARLANPSCGACHVQFEPYAFALHKWGGDGTFMNEERLNDGGPVTTSLGTFAFSGYREFLPQVGASEQYRRCITDQFVRYGLRHTEYPAGTVDQVLGSAGETLTFRSLVRSLVVQEVFAQR